MPQSPRSKAFAGLLWPLAGAGHHWKSARSELRICILDFRPNEPLWLAFAFPQQPFQPVDNHTGRKLNVLDTLGLLSGFGMLIGFGSMRAIGNGTTDTSVFSLAAWIALTFFWVGAKLVDALLDNRTFCLATA